MTTKTPYELYDNNEIIVEADKNRLSQVVYNLLNNAFNFIDEDSITVIVTKKKEYANDNCGEFLLV
jgi:signal transduction histidine kinase